MTHLEEQNWKAVAKANILQARKRHGRGGTKSRSGCLVCKSRRIKCDEGRPHCQRCSTTGRRCEYEEAVPASSSTSSKSPGSSLVSRTPSIERRLSLSFELKESDQRTYDYFVSWTAPRLGGSLDRNFWCGPVLGKTLLNSSNSCLLKERSY